MTRDVASQAATRRRRHGNRVGLLLSPLITRSTTLMTKLTMMMSRPLLQLQTVTSVLMIRPDEQFSFQIATERGWKVAAA